MAASVTEAVKGSTEVGERTGHITASAVVGKSSMRAGRWDPEQKMVVIYDVPVPEPGPNQFLIRMASASLCHSDIMAIEANYTNTLGHEGAGYIEKVHHSVEHKGFEVGDRVGFLYIIGCCFACEGCMIHNLHCVTGKQLLQGFTTDGFFAEYAVVDMRNCTHLPESLKPEDAAPIFCAGITAFHAVDSSELRGGDWLAVVGAGGLGQLATQIAKKMELKVVALDINDSTLEVCKKQGADAVFNSQKNKNYVEELKELTNGGVKAACVFSNADAAYAAAPAILRLGGIIMVVGLPQNPLQISSMDLALGKYKIKSESTSIPQRMKKAVDFFAKNNIQPEIQRRNLDELDAMVNEMRSGSATKRMLVNFD